MRESSAPEKRQKVELTPPPRIRENAPVMPETAWNPGQPRAAKVGGRGVHWLTAAAFLVLIGVAAAVFVVLPDWAKQRRMEKANAVATSRDINGEFKADDATVDDAIADSPDDFVDVAESDEFDKPDVGEGLAPVAVASIPVASAPAGEPTPNVTVPQATVPRATVPRATAQEPAMDEGFIQAMTDGLAALESNDFETARKAFELAQGISPGSPQVVDGLARADAGRRQQQIADHQAHATSLAGEEKWRDALGHYEAVLELDPTVRFAQEGRDLARDRAELLDDLQRHVAHPDRLSTPAVLEEASQLAARASDIDNSGPRHRHLVSDLQRLVEVFSTPVRAHLRSDQQTEIMVYKVGRLGVFDERALDLRPGSYTVVGSRRGYRDVRRQLVIEPGKAPEPLLVRCEEKI